MVRFVSGFLGLCLAVIGAIALTTYRAPTATACTGGGPGGIEELSQLPFIFSAEALSVGGPLNAAPTVTPTSSPVPSPTPTSAAGSATAVAPSPVSPPFAMTPALPRPSTVDLTGIGATLRVVHIYAGALGATIDVDDATRANLEQFLRQQEVSNGISDCTADRFVARYVPGRSYLVFAVQSAGGTIETSQLFPLDGDDVLLNDPLLSTTFLDTLFVTPTIRARFFSDVQARVGSDIAVIEADRVPLDDVLRAIASLRGDRSIAPPETGSAGLAALRE